MTTTPQSIATRAADLIEHGHWAAGTLRAAFSYAVDSNRYSVATGGTHADYEAAMAFERHWIGARQHRNDGLLISETASDRAARVGPVETVAALRAFAAAL